MIHEVPTNTFVNPADYDCTYDSDRLNHKVNLWLKELRYFIGPLAEFSHLA